MTLPIHTFRLLAVLVLGLLIASCSQPTENAAPTVSLSASKTSLESAGNITLTAEASDDKGVSKVEFYQGSTKLGEDTSKPYTLDVALSAANNGTLSYTAKAFDASGKTGSSEAVKVVVDIDNTPPTISLVASSSNLSSAGSITLNASVTDNKGVVKVEFFKGTDKLGEDITPADGFIQVVAVGAEQNGSFKYSAKAFDANGNSATSAEVGVTVDIDVTSPTVSLSVDKTSVTSAGPALLIATASDNKGVARVEFYEGAVNLGQDVSAPFAFEVNYTAAQNGTHQYMAKAFDGAGNSATSQPLNLVVNIDITSPTVSLASDKQTVISAGRITLNATANDNVGITKVEFFRGTSKLGQKFAAPYTWTPSLSDADNGTVSFSAKAYDADGNMATSNTVEVVVDIDVVAPTVSLASSNTSVGARGHITLTATATDNKGIAKVEFYNGAVKVAQVSASPYTVYIGFLSNDNGTHTFTAKATDTSGNSTISDAVLVDVDGTPPELSLSASSTNVTAAGSITLSATATDNNSISRVEFYDFEDNKLGEDTEAPYTHDIPFTADDNGSYTVKAKAFDTAGNSSAAQVGVSVDIDETPPAVSLVSSSTSVSTAGSITLTATASDAYGIDKVEFYSGATLLATDSTGADGYTHSISYTGLDSADYTYTAKAYDTRGNLDTSNSVGVTVAIFYYTSVAAGYNHSCAIGWNAKAYCWGNGGSGELGNGSTSNSANPVAVTMPSDLTFSQIATGTFFSCALGSDNKAYCWGLNNGGQVGNSSNTNVSVPTAVTMPVGVSFAQIAAGTDHACALDLTGNAYCWGSGGSGRLGNSTSTNSSVPVAVVMPTGISFTQLGLGFLHSCALGSDGKVYCWGGNSTNQLGNGTSTQSTVPVSVSMPSGVSFSQVAAGLSHTCALTSTGTVYCWGDGASGKLGNNATSNSNVPVAVTMPSGVVFSQLGLGSHHSCALSNAGVAYCWGSSGVGQLGNNTYIQSNIPTLVSMPSGVSFMAIRAGRDHSCAVGSDGNAYCWGDGGGYRLGTESTTSVKVPTLVRTP